MTPLLNGQAVNARLASTSVTGMRRSSCLSARATLAPAKPPPTTTTCGSACAMAGRGISAADAATAAEEARRSRRVIRLPVIAGPSTLRRIPGRDGLDLGVGKPFGDLVHHGRLTFAGTERLHLRREFPGVAPGEPRHRRVHAGICRMTAGARRRARRCLGGHRRRERDRRKTEHGDGEEPRVHVTWPSEEDERRAARPPLAVRHAICRFWFLSGNVRMRLPVALK